jgi:hypothetical protein
MSVRESRLSREKEARYADRLRQLHAEGIDVELPEELEENSRALDIQLAPPSESIVYETSRGGLYYAIPVRLLALQSGLTLTDWDMTTGWDDQIVAESYDDGSPIYRLGDQEYQPCQVLNQKIERNLTLRRGQIAEGWILASGLRPIPPQYHDCFTAPFEVRFFDQFGCAHPADGTLSVLRRDRSNVLPGTGLYGLDATGKPRESSVSSTNRSGDFRSVLRVVIEVEELGSGRIGKCWSDAE